MKRMMAAGAVLGLLAGACGGGDDAAPNDSSGASTEDTGESDDVGDNEASSDDSDADQSADGDQTDEPAGVPGSDGTDDGTEAAATGGDAIEDDDDDVGPVPISSFSDIPEVCLEQMAGFLRDIEPIVSAIDWETATIADFEQLAGDLEAAGEQFDTASEDVGCDDLDFVEDNENELLIEFAKNEAPGVVGFLEFTDRLDSVGSSGDGGLGGDPASGSAIETCADGIAFVQSLFDKYDSFTEVSATELLQLTELASLYITCTPEQLEFLNSDELSAFLNE